MVQFSLETTDYSSYKKLIYEQLQTRTIPLPGLRMCVCERVLYRSVCVCRGGEAREGVSCVCMREGVYRGGEAPELYLFIVSLQIFTVHF